MPKTDPNTLLVKQTLTAVDSYRGDTAGYETVMAALIALDAAVKAADIDVPPDSQNSDAERERIFTQTYGGQAVTVDDLLSRGDANARVFLKQLLAGDKGAQLNAELAGITLVDSPYVFVPPEAQEPPMTGDGDSEWQEPRFANRLEQVLIFLKEKTLNGVTIHWDDLIVYKGAVSDTQLREAPYHIIDIIPWNMQIAVCDQIGNALFVVPQRLSVWEWTQYGKEALVEKFNAQRIVMGKDWDVKLSESLNTVSSNLVNMERPARSTIRNQQRQAQEGYCLFTKNMHDVLEAECHRTGKYGGSIANGLGAILSR